MRKLLRLIQQSITDNWGQCPGCGKYHGFDEELLERRGDRWHCRNCGTAIAVERQHEEWWG